MIGHTNILGVVNLEWLAQRRICIWFWAGIRKLSQHCVQTVANYTSNNTNAWLCVYKKAQLTLTYPRDAKACWKLLQFDVKISCRQVNNLFEVMQQPSAPSREWYWRTQLENSLFSPPRTCLTPHSGRTPCDINVTYSLLKSAFSGLQFRRW